LREQVKKYGVDGDALPPTQVAPEEEVELSSWGRPYTRYRCDEKEKKQ